MPGLFRRWVAVRIVEKVSGSLGDAEQAIFARHLMMDACRRHQMPHVVHLKIEAITKRLNTVITISVCDQDGRVKVTVASLCLAYDRDDFIKSLIPDMVLVDGLQQANRFDPFVEVAVIERRAAVPAFRHSRGDAEMFQVRLVLRSPHDFPHRWDGLATTAFQTLSPKTVGPVHFLDRDWFSRAERGRCDRLSSGIACKQPNANVNCEDVEGDSHEALSVANGGGELKTSLLFANVATRHELFAHSPDG